MNAVETNISLDAYHRLCEALDMANLLIKDDSQYGAFERVYKEAIEEMIANMLIVKKYKPSVSLQDFYLTTQSRLH